MFPDEPALSLPREGIKFTISPDGQPVGRVRLGMGIGARGSERDHQPGTRPGRAVVIPALEILRPITLLAEAISGPAYSRGLRQDPHPPT